LTMNALYQICDEAVFVANRDPAGAFAHRQALLLISGCIRPDAYISVVINDNSVAVASLGVLRNDACSVPGRSIRHVTIPRNPKASQWACSGATPYQFLDRFIDRLVECPPVGEASVARDGGVGDGRWYSAALARMASLARTFRSGKRCRLSKEPASDPHVERQVFPAIGFTECALGDGELVSKPVILT
jgi:hypothetical protein